MDGPTDYFRYTFLPACYDLSDCQVRRSTYLHQAMSLGFRRLIQSITLCAEDAVRREISSIASSWLIDSGNGPDAMALIDSMGRYDGVLRVS